MKALVTGATRGIGKSIFEELSKDFKVYAVARNKKKLSVLDAEGYYVCDLAGDINGLCGYIKNSGFDIIINNAGQYIYEDTDNITDDQIRTIFNTNLIAPIRIVSSAIPYMKRKKWGRIINIGSISGVMGEAYAALYSSSKSGLIGLTKSLALELAEYNITVNTINPGWVDTELGNKSIDDSEFSKEEIADTIPQRRFVEPYEIAKMVRYLISEDAKGVTGQSVNICAGLSVGI